MSEQKVEMEELRIARWMPVVLQPSGIAVMTTDPKGYWVERAAAEKEFSRLTEERDKPRHMSLVELAMVHPNLQEYLVQVEKQVVSAEAESKRLAEELAEARKMVELLVASAYPNPRDPPALAKAWSVARAWLSRNKPLAERKESP